MSREVNVRSRTLESLSYMTLQTGYFPSTFLITVLREVRIEKAAQIYIVVQIRTLRGCGDFCDYFTQILIARGYCRHFVNAEDCQFGGLLKLRSKESVLVVERGKCFFRVWMLPSSSRDLQSLNLLSHASNCFLQFEFWNCKIWFSCPTHLTSARGLVLEKQMSSAP
jgi:hypothetical protein